ncbi:hypothetical protein PROFUN_00562 [Planoprotostelium fungivorum]|uniref:CRAL-TRIO domain-containing protein n=1 Tax=Planoprotostelium fungivorum TaxID=1890364 RepID=A0A2P6N196_9EUKA|nr:hypothetical protein PROFUN_00562 [Planoprotostelium fungivorum]
MDCRSVTDLPRLPRVLSLSEPTGGLKVLRSLRFALSNPPWQRVINPSKAEMQQPANRPTQVNYAGDDTIKEVEQTPEDLELIKQFRDTVAERIKADGGIKATPGWKCVIEPGKHWRDVYNARTHLTNVKVSPDPRGKPDLDMNWYSPSTQPQNWSNALCLKFLRARQRDLNKTVDMFMNYLYFRESYGVDDLIRQDPMPFDDVIESFIAHNIHKPDRNGQPVYLQRTGLINGGEFAARVDSDVLALGHIHFMERCLQAMDNSSRARGARVEKMTTVVDTKGMNLGHRSMLYMFRITTFIDQNYYPETLGAFYMVNAPPLLPTLYGMIRPLLDPVTQEKIFCLSGKSVKKTLVERLGEEFIPVEYGGTCACEGGCLGYVNQIAEEDKALVQGLEEKEEKEEAIRVGAGVEKEVVIEVNGTAEQPVCQVWWSFKIARQNIIFSGQFVSEGESYPVAQPLKQESEEVVRGVFTFTDMDKPSNHGKSLHFERFDSQMWRRAQI